MDTSTKNQQVSNPIRFRIKAGLIHLIGSFLIALISLYLIFYIWHPAPLAKAVGVTDIFLMMLAIDAILGPLLTLIVAKPNKKSLKFDLAVIIVLQLAAYIYGMYNITLNRPVYIAFDTKRFELVQASDIPRSSLKKAEDEYRALGYGKPDWVAVIPFKTPDEQMARISDETNKGISPSMQPNLYEPLENQWSTISNAVKDLDELANENDPDKVDEILSNYNTVNGWLPLKAYSESMVVLLNTDENEVIDIVDLRPW